MFAHGLGASIAETRLLASGVPGTRVFFASRGHPPTTSPAGTRLGYPELAGDLDAVARRCGARRAVGVSLGAATLLTLLAREPDRFERVVLFLPAVLDRVRADAGTALLGELAAAIEDGDPAGVAAVLAAQLPDLPGVADYIEDRSAQLAGSPVAQVLRAVLPAVPVADRAELNRVRAPVLVIGQEGDPVHPAGVARAVAAALPAARLELFDQGAALWRSRARLRVLISAFLGQ